MPALLPFLTPDLTQALAGSPGPLRVLLESVRAYESGVEQLGPGSPVALSVLAEAYLDALAWTTNVTRDASAF